MSYFQLHQSVNQLGRVARCQSNSLHTCIITGFRELNLLRKKDLPEGQETAGIALTGFKIDCTFDRNLSKTT